MHHQREGSAFHHHWSPGTTPITMAMLAGLLLTTESTSPA